MHYFGNSRPTQANVRIKDLTEVTDDIRTCIIGLLLTYPIMKKCELQKETLFDYLPTKSTAFIAGVSSIIS